MKLRIANRAIAVAVMAIVLAAVLTVSALAYGVDLEGKVTGLENGVTYTYAKYDFATDSYGTYNSLDANTVLTAGVWGIKAGDAAPEVVFVQTSQTGTIYFWDSTSNALVAEADYIDKVTKDTYIPGKWTGSSFGANGGAFSATNYPRFYSGSGYASVLFNTMRESFLVYEKGTEKDGNNKYTFTYKAYLGDTSATSYKNATETTKGNYWLLGDENRIQESKLFYGFTNEQVVPTSAFKGFATGGGMNITGSLAVNENYVDAGTDVFTPKLTLYIKTVGSSAVQTYSLSTTAKVNENITFTLADNAPALPAGYIVGFDIAIYDSIPDDFLVSKNNTEQATGTNASQHIKLAKGGNAFDIAAPAYEAPTGLGVADGKVTGLVATKYYQYANVSVGNGVVLEYGTPTALTETTEPKGLFAVRETNADGTVFSQWSALFFIEGGEYVVYHQTTATEKTGVDANGDGIASGQATVLEIAPLADNADNRDTVQFTSGKWMGLGVTDYGFLINYADKWYNEYRIGTTGQFMLGSTKEGYNTYYYTYKFAPDEVIPMSSFSSYTFEVYPRQSYETFNGSVVTKVTFVVVTADGKFETRTVTKDVTIKDNKLTTTKHVVNASDFAKTDGYLVGIVINPFYLTDGTTLTAGTYKPSVALTMFEDSWAVKGKAKAPTFSVALNDAQTAIEVTITNATATTSYRWKKAGDADWTNVPAGEESFEVTALGDYVVEAYGELLVGTAQATCTVGKLAPTAPSVSYEAESETLFKVTVNNPLDIYTYEYDNNGTWTAIVDNAFTVNAEGTYKVRAGGAWFDGYAEATVNVVGIPAAVKNIVVANKTISSLDSTKSYEYAPVTLKGIGDTWTAIPAGESYTFTEGGLYAIRLAASGSEDASVSKMFFIEGGEYAVFHYTTDDPYDTNLLKTYKTNPHKQVTVGGVAYDVWSDNGTGEYYLNSKKYYDVTTNEEHTMTGTAKRVYDTTKTRQVIEIAPLSDTTANRETVQFTPKKWMALGTTNYGLLLNYNSYYNEHLTLIGGTNQIVGGQTREALNAGYYSYEFGNNEIMPLSYLSSFSFNFWPRQVYVTFNGTVNAKVVLKVMTEDGIVEDRAVSIPYVLNSSKQLVASKVTVTAADLAETDGYLMGIVIYPISLPEATTFTFTSAANLSHSIYLADDALMVEAGALTGITGGETINGISASKNYLYSSYTISADGKSLVASDWTELDHDNLPSGLLKLREVVSGIVVTAPSDIIYVYGSEADRTEIGNLVDMGYVDSSYGPYRYDYKKGTEFVTGKWTGYGVAPHKSFPVNRLSTTGAEYVSKAQADEAKAAYDVYVAAKAAADAAPEDTALAAALADAKAAYEAKAAILKDALTDPGKWFGYAFEGKEITPISEVYAFNFKVGLRQSPYYNSEYTSTAVAYVADLDGTVTEYTYVTPAAKSDTVRTVDFTDASAWTPALPAEGYLVGIKVLSLAGIEDLYGWNYSSTGNSMPYFDIEAHIIKTKAVAPVLTVAVNAKSEVEVTVDNAVVGANYRWKKDGDADWTDVPAGETSFVVAGAGTYTVEVYGGSVIGSAQANFTVAQLAAPDTLYFNEETNLVEGFNELYTYYYAPYTVNGLGEKSTFDSKTTLELEAGLWGIGLISEEDGVIDSVPVFIYVKGDEAARQELGTRIDAAINNGFYQVVKGDVWEQGKWSGVDLAHAGSGWSSGTSSNILSATGGHVSADGYLKPLRDAIDSGDAVAEAAARQAIADKAASVQFKYAYENNEVIPADELVSFKFTSKKRLGSLDFGAGLTAKVTFFVVDENGAINEYVWTQATSLGETVHEVDFTEAEGWANGAPTEGWIVALEINPWTNVNPENVSINRADFTEKLPNGYNTIAQLIINDYTIKLAAAKPDVKALGAPEDGYGEITGLNPLMSYELATYDEGTGTYSEYVAVPAGVTSFALPKGKYLIRVAESKYFTESEEAPVVIETLGKFTTLENEVKKIHLPNDFTEVTADYEIDATKKTWIARLALDNMKTVAPESKVIIVGDGYKFILKASDITTDKMIHYYNLAVSFDGESRHDMMYDVMKELAGKQYVTEIFFESTELLPFESAELHVEIDEEYDGMTVELRSYNERINKLRNVEEVTVENGWAVFTSFETTYVILSPEE